MSGSTAAVRARAASATSTAEISRERTRRAVSSAESSQSSGILGPLDLGHHQEAVQGRRRVGEELLARQAGADAILGIVPRFRRRPRRPAPPTLNGGLVLPELVDVVDDLTQLAGEARLLFRRQTEPRQDRDLSDLVSS